MSSINSKTKQKQKAEATTWDSDIEVSSDDDIKSNDSDGKSTKTKTKSNTPLPQAPPTTNDTNNDDSKEKETEKKKTNSPSHLKLSLLDNYSHSKMYNKIRKRRVQKKLNNDDLNDMHMDNIRIEKADSLTPTKKLTINDLRSHRILYEMNSYECKWYWIDSLPTDDSNDYQWIQHHSNINLFNAVDEEKQPQNDVLQCGEYRDIAQEINDNNSIQVISVPDFDHTLNELRKSVINSPLFPELGCMGYCKEFYVTLCDWNAEGVLSIKYVSDESQRQISESKSRKTCNGYWQKLRYQMSVSGNGKYIAILFDRFCVIRSYKNRFYSDLYSIKLPFSFWQYTQFRFIKWSKNNELLAISSYNANIIIYDNKCNHILAFNANNANMSISGLIWRKYIDIAVADKKSQSAANYCLELIILFDSGELHRRSFDIAATTLEVLNFDKQTRITTIQYPHGRICKWIYDGIDYYDGDGNGKRSYMAVSCLPLKLLDTKPRQSRLGHGLMLLQFEGTNCRVFAHYNSRIPSNSYFSVDSVCFTMADRRAKLYGRHVHISPDGKHVLCLDLRGNMELFDDNLQLVAKVGNAREMSYGSYPSQSRIFCMKWWDNESVIILFCNNTFCITPLICIKHYNQRDMKWSLNYLGQSREQLYGLPIISNTVPIAGEEEQNSNAMFFILEISETYLRRTDDQHLKYVAAATNDIDRKQNEIYGYRKYRNISLATFCSITAAQLFEKYLENDKYDKALQIADMFKLKTDKAYQSQFNFLIKQYNNDHNDNQQQQQPENNNQQQQSDLFAILEKMEDELWIIDSLLSVWICDFNILDALLYYGISLMEKSERLRGLRPHGFSQFLKYRERAMSLKRIRSIEECFDYDYVAFRDANIIEIGYELASKDLLAALAVIFKYHWHEIEKEDRLRILSYIPLSIHPKLYFNILPCTDAAIWETDRWFAKEFGLAANDMDDEKRDTLDRDQIVDWYKKRIYDIEKMTGNVENALILCNFAVSNQKIFELKCLLEILLLFHKIVYEYNADCNMSLLEFESMDSSQKLLFVLRNSDYTNIINHIHQRAEYFVSERDLSMVLLDLCPKLSEIGKIELVAAILDSHQEFDLLNVIKSYFTNQRKENIQEIKHDRDVNEDEWDEFEDNFSDNEAEPNESKVAVDKYDGMTERDLLIEYALLNALKCTAANCWQGFDKLLLTINNIKSTEKKERITQMTAFIKGGAQLTKSYNIDRSLVFYSTLFNIAHITKTTDTNISKENILKWKDILNVSDHQLSNYEALNLLLTQHKAVIDENVVTTLHDLAIDITTDLFRGIQQKARKFEKDEEWEKLREDLLNFQAELFPFIPLETMEFEFMRIMFECCSFSFISKTMKCQHPPISNEHLIQLSLKTASELIDASISYESVTLIEAQNCLSIIPKKFRNSEFWKLWDLISAVKLLHDEFNCDVIPFQLKKLFILKSNNKYFTDKQREFIINILECNASDNYLKKDYLISIMEYLSFDNENMNEYKMELLCILSDYGLKQMEKHFKSTNQISIKSGLECQLFSYEIYLEIFDKNYIKKRKKYPKYIMSLLWNICCKLMESTQHPNNINNLQLLSHSLTTSSNNKIYKILKLWQSVNSKENYQNIIHSIAVSLRKRKADYVSDSDDSEDNNNDNNDWTDFIQDIGTRPVLYTKMTKQEIKNEINMNEMEKMVHLYFNTDPDVLSNYKNDEIYSFMSKTNKYWKTLDVLSNSLIPCSNVNMLLHPNKIENFEILILKIIENIYLCDKIQLITFLLLIDDINVMNKSFVAVLAHKNIPKNKKIDIIQIAIKYFMYQTINKLQQYYECEDEYIENDEIYDLLPSNIADIFFMEMIKDTDDDIDDDDDVHYKITIKDLLKCKQLSGIKDENVRKCHSKSIYFYDKWCKWTKNN